MDINIVKSQTKLRFLLCVVFGVFMFIFSPFWFGNELEIQKSPDKIGARRFKNAFCDVSMINSLHNEHLASSAKITCFNLIEIDVRGDFLTS